ncbi:YojJ domain-containing protein [Bacillus velezensis]|nr:YojJ domain-containing protein [Bacillus velezensis]
MGHTFQEMQAVASSFYLQSYIEHFTPSYTELARAVRIWRKKTRSADCD